MLRPMLGVLVIAHGWGHAVLPLRGLIVPETLAQDFMPMIFYGVATRRQGARHVVENDVIVEGKGHVLEGDRRRLTDRREERGGSPSCQHRLGWGDDVEGGGHEAGHGDRHRSVADSTIVVGRRHTDAHARVEDAQTVGEDPDGVQVHFQNLGTMGRER